MRAGKAIRAAAAALCLLAHLLLGAPIQAQLRGGDSDIAAFMDRHVASEVRRLNIPGAALAVVRDGRVILVKGLRLCGPRFRAADDSGYDARTPVVDHENLDLAAGDAAG
jgi:CubicO group peptidase (beta-lactamase class C family)